MDEPIITNAMLHEADGKRIAELEAALRDARALVVGGATGGAIVAVIDAALAAKGE